MLEHWPTQEENWVSPEIEAKMSFVIRAISAIRNLRTELHVPPQAEISVYQPISDISLAVPPYGPFLAKYAKVKVVIREDDKKPSGSATLLIDNRSLHVLLEGIIDLEKEKERISEEIEKREMHQQKTKERLSDERFLSGAPEEVVEQFRQTLQDNEEGIQKLETLLRELR